MADLSKEHFDEQIAQLATKDDVDRQADETIDAQTEALTRVIREGFEELYRRLRGRG